MICSVFWVFSPLWLLLQFTFVIIVVRNIPNFALLRLPSNSHRTIRGNIKVVRNPSVRRLEKPCSVFAPSTRCVFFADPWRNWWQLEWCLLFCLAKLLSWWLTGSKLNLLFVLRLFAGITVKCKSNKGQKRTRWGKTKTKIILSLKQFLECVGASKSRGESTPFCSA